MKRVGVTLALLLSAVLPGTALAEDDWDVVEDEPAEVPVQASATQEDEPEVEAETESSTDDFSLLGGDSLSWKGYLESQANGFKLPRKRTNPDGSGWDVMAYNRLRLDLSARPSPAFKLDATVVARTFHGSTSYDLRNMLAKKFDAELDLLALLSPSSLQFQLRDEIFVDNAYFTADAGPFRLRVGKQQMRFGSGYLWNPTDPFNTKDLLDPTYEVTGVMAMRLQLFLPHEGLIEAYVLPHKRLEEFHAESMAGALRARIAIDRWMGALTYAYFRDLVGVDPVTFDPLDARRNLFGLELTGELGGVGVWLEGAFNLTDRKRDAPVLEAFGNPQCAGDLEQLCWFEAVAGLNYTFDGGLMVQAEYLYNGRGSADSMRYELVDWFAYMEQSLRYLGEHYVTAMAQIGLDTTHVTLTAMAVANLSDGSVMVTPWIQWDWSQNLAVTFFGALNYADNATDEFRSVGQAGYLRFRFSF